MPPKSKVQTNPSYAEVVKKPKQLPRPRMIRNGKPVPAPTEEEAAELLLGLARPLEDVPTASVVPGDAEVEKEGSLSSFEEGSAGLGVEQDEETCSVIGACTCFGVCLDAEKAPELTDDDEPPVKEEPVEKMDVVNISFEVPLENGVDIMNLPSDTSLPDFRPLVSDYTHIPLRYFKTSLCYKFNVYSSSPWRMVTTPAQYDAMRQEAFDLITGVKSKRSPKDVVVMLKFGTKAEQKKYRQEWEKERAAAKQTSVVNKARAEKSAANTGLEVRHSNL